MTGQARHRTDGETTRRGMTGDPTRDKFQTLGRWTIAHAHLLLSFLLPMGVRTIPEIMAGPWPIGFDTVWAYAPFMRDVQTKGLAASLGDVIGAGTAPLVFLLLGLGAASTGVPPIALTKVAAPLIYGFLGFSLYYLGRRGFGWDRNKSLLLVVVTTLYFVPLRFSWDMYKNTVGLSLFLLGLSHARPGANGRRVVTLVVLSGLSILSSELMAALVAGTFGLLFVWSWVKDRTREWSAFALSGVGVLSTLFYAHLIAPAVLPPSPVAPAPQQSSLLINYVGSNIDAYVYPALGDVYLAVLLLTGFLLGPILPLTVQGFLRERRLLVVCAVLGCGSFSLLVSPFAALPAWHRWLFMLVFPALFFATLGLTKLGRRSRTVILALLMVFGSVYVVAPDGAAFPYYSTSSTSPYVPSSLMRNTVPLQDCPDIVVAANWLNELAPSASVLVANIRFAGWAKLYVSTMEAYWFGHPGQVERGNFSAYEHVYVLDWAVGRGEFRPDLLPEGAVEIFVSGRIAVYEIVS